MITRFRAQAGDTIVEVLIAILVVSLVLAGAYASTNHNVLAGQDTLEHSQALQLVQSQVEFMRAATVASRSIPNATPKNCYVMSSGNPAAASTDCTVDRGGTVNCHAVEPCYTLAIVGPNPAGVYKVSATWSSLLAGQTNTVSIYYEP